MQLENQVELPSAADAKNAYDANFDSKEYEEQLNDNIQLPKYALSIALMLSAGILTALSIALSQTNIFFMIIGVIFSVLSAYLTVRSTDELLKAKRLSLDKWWLDMSRDTRKFMDENEGRHPKSASKNPDESACGIWIADARRVGEGGKLTSFQRKCADDAGIVWRTEPVIVEDNYNMPISFADILALSSIYMLFFVLCAIWGMPHLLATASSVAVASLLVCSACDLRARIIPWQALIVSAGAGISMLVFEGNEPGGIGIWLAIVLAAYIAVKIFERIAQSMGKAGQIGGGDMRMFAVVLIIAQNSGFLYGALLSSVVFIINFIVMRISGKWNLKTQIPLAPYLAMWGISSILIMQLFAAFGYIL